MDGTHSLERCAEVTAATLRSVYEQLTRHRVVLEASLLKPNMVLSGADSPVQASLGEVADATITVLRERCPQRFRGSCSSPAASPRRTLPSASTR